MAGPVRNGLGIGWKQAVCSATHPDHCEVMCPTCEVTVKRQKRRWGEPRTDIVPFAFSAPRKGPGWHLEACPHCLAFVGYEER